MTDDRPFADTLTQILAAIDEPFESIRMTLDQHPPHTLGDPAEEGSAAWHLVHTALVFRTHARHLVGTQTEDWPEIPADVEGAITVLRQDAERVRNWASTNLDPNISITYGQDQSASQMLGIMLRHIVWHAAAAHYWCKWKRPA